MDPRPRGLLRRENGVKHGLVVEVFQYIERPFAHIRVLVGQGFPESLSRCGITQISKRFCARQRQKLQWASGRIPEC